MKKLLVIQLGTATEVLLSTPLLRGIKKALPQCELHYLLHHTNAEVLAGNPYINHLHQLHFHIQTSVHELMPQAFDGVLNLQPNGLANELLHALDAPIIQHHQKGFKAFLKNLFSSKVAGHTAERYLKVALPLGVKNDGFGLDYFIPRSAEVPYADIPVSHSAGFIALAVNSDHLQWGWDLFLQQLLSKTAHPVILIGTNKDVPSAEKLKALDEVKIYNACGKFNPHETADLVRKSKLLVSANSFYIQLAAAFNKPTVWLPTNKSDASPYYSLRFLQTKTGPAYTAVNKPALLKQDNKVQTTKGEEAIQQWVQQTFTAIQEQLAAPA